MDDESRHPLWHPNRGWFLGAAFLMTLWILDRIDAPLWTAILTLVLLLSAAASWIWIERTAKRRRLFWIVLFVYSGLGDHIPVFAEANACTRPSRCARSVTE